MTQFDQVIQKSGFQPIQCACKRCVQMCKHTPCMGTPEDTANLIRAGYANRLVKTLWAAGAIHGIPPVEMLQPRYDEQRGCCTFLTDAGLCELHESGLKPTEGKLATCDESKIVTTENHPAFIIAKMWEGVFAKPNVSRERR